MDLAAPVRAVAIACSKIEPREKVVLTQYLTFERGDYGRHAANRWAPRWQLSRGRARDRKGSRARFGLARVWPPAQTCEEITSKKVAARRGLKRRHCRRAIPCTRRSVSKPRYALPPLGTAQVQSAPVSPMSTKHSTEALASLHNSLPEIDRVEV